MVSDILPKAMKNQIHIGNQIGNLTWYNMVKHGVTWGVMRKVYVAILVLLVIVHNRITRFMPSDF